MASPVTLAPEVRRFLEAPGRYAVVAVTGADGTPHQAVTWYRLDETDILINTRVGRRWPAELQRDPRISVTVHEQQPKGQEYVIIQGTAALVASGAEAMADIQALAVRYGGDPAGYVGQERLSFRVTPLHVGTHGNLAR